MSEPDPYTKPIDTSNPDKLAQWRKYFPNDNDYDNISFVFGICKEGKFENYFGSPMTVCCPNHSKLTAIVLKRGKKMYFLGYVTNAKEVSEMKYLKPYASVIWSRFPERSAKSFTLLTVLKHANCRIRNYQSILEKKQLIPSSYEKFEFERYILFHICKHFEEGVKEFIFLEKKLFQIIRTAALCQRMVKLCDIPKGISIESYIEGLYTQNAPKTSFDFDAVALKFVESYLHCVPYQLCNIARGLGYI